MLLRLDKVYYSSMFKSLFMPLFPSRWDYWNAFISFTWPLDGSEYCSLCYFWQLINILIILSWWSFWTGFTVKARLDFKVLLFTYLLYNPHWESQIFTEKLNCYRENVFLFQATMLTSRITLCKNLVTPNAFRVFVLYRSCF